MDDSDDELPAITVQFLSPESAGESGGSGSMPSAGDIAAERERERRIEDELRRLRDIELQAVSDPNTARTDSSGSEGEAALAAAVRALHVPDAARRRTRADANALAVAMLQRAGGPRLHSLYAAALLQRGGAPRPRDTRALLLAAAGAAPCAAGAALVPLVAAALAAPSVRARRTLHRALAAADEDAVCAVASEVAAAAVQCGGVTALLRVADAVRGGAGTAGGARLLHELTVRYGLQLLLCGDAGAGGGAPSLEELTSLAASRGRELQGPARVSALRLCARSRCPDLVMALTCPAASSGRVNKDSHQVAVAASTLRLLYKV